MRESTLQKWQQCHLSTIQINYMLLVLGIYQLWIDPCKWRHNTAGKVTSSSACLGKKKKQKQSLKTVVQPPSLWQDSIGRQLLKGHTFRVSFSWKCPFEFDQRGAWISCCRSDETTWASSQVEKATCVMDYPSCHLCMTDIKGQQAASRKDAKSQHRPIELEQCP